MGVLDDGEIWFDTPIAKRAREMEEAPLSGVVIDRPCAVTLMEPQWEEGFECVLVAGHDGPHRDELDSTDSQGRAYRMAYEWWYPAPEETP